jgi:hypothetical protein
MSTEYRVPIIMSCFSDFSQQRLPDQVVAVQTHKDKTLHYYVLVITHSRPSETASTGTSNTPPSPPISTYLPTLPT